jgi:hypothetical protein
MIAPILFAITLIFEYDFTDYFLVLFFGRK